MIYRLNEIMTTEKLQEIVQGAKPDFPHIATESDIESYADRCVPWHWHDYFEFVVVQCGEVEVCTQSQSLRLHAGEGYFVNSEVMHLCRVADGNEHVKLLVHKFDRSLIASSAAVARRYVQSVESCTALDVLAFRLENPIHARLIEELNAAFADAAKEAEGFELAITVRLMRAWELMYHLAEPRLKDSKAVAFQDTSRIKLMLACIHTRYNENLSVATIAQAANICTRECFRCFQQVLGTTPALYLMRHRVNAAMRLLADTDRSVTDVAAACGFSSPSYFCKVFRDVMGLSPREFRKRRES